MVTLLQWKFESHHEMHKKQNFYSNKLTMVKKSVTSRVKYCVTSSFNMLLFPKTNHISKLKQLRSSVLKTGKGYWVAKMELGGIPKAVCVFPERVA